MKIERGSRVVFDTNIWITFLIGKRFVSLQSFINNNNLLILYSDELIKEIELVVSREKFRKYFLKKDMEKIISIFNIIGEEISVRSNVDICRDVKDNFLLCLCKDGKADYLISNDNDLLILKKFEHTSIVSLIQFLR